MNDLFQVIDNLIKQTNKNRSTVEFDDTNIKKCVELLDSGFKIIEYQVIPNSYSLNLIFKSGEDQKIIKLTVSEQKVWLDVLNQRRGLKDVKFI